MHLSVEYVYVYMITVYILYDYILPENYYTVDAYVKML
jgi:hypothetical protein